MKVLSIEQMNRLKELGVNVSNASVRVGQIVFYHGDSWYCVDSYNVHLFKDDDDDTSCFEEEYKAFSLQVKKNGCGGYYVIMALSASMMDTMRTMTKKEASEYLAELSSAISQPSEKSTLGL